MKMNFSLIIRGSAGILFLIALLLLLAGRLNYWQAWLFGLICSLVVIGISLFFGKNFKDIQERMKSGPGTKWWDILFWLIYGPMNIAIPVVAGLDAGRFHWSPAYSPYLYFVAYLIFIVSAFFHIWAIRTNKFYASTVRIQHDREQIVISNGPYRYIRHPGYLGIMLMVSSMALALGSVWALLPAALVSVLLFIRTALEDQTLQKELTGYTEYCQKVKFRLLPGIW